VLIVIVAVLARNGPGDRLGRVIVDYVMLRLYTILLYLLIEEIKVQLIVCL
jgi:hypothetical protein